MLYEYIYVPLNNSFLPSNKYPIVEINKDFAKRLGLLKK
jgi:hypothetical protein